MSEEFPAEEFRDIVTRHIARLQEMIDEDYYGNWREHDSIYVDMLYAHAHAQIAYLKSRLER